MLNYTWYKSTSFLDGYYYKLNINLPNESLKLKATSQLVLVIRYYLLGLVHEFHVFIPSCRKSNQGATRTRCYRKSVTCGLAKITCQHFLTPLLLLAIP